MTLEGFVSLRRFAPRVPALTSAPRVKPLPVDGAAHIKGCKVGEDSARVVVLHRVGHHRRVRVEAPAGGEDEVVVSGGLRALVVVLEEAGVQVGEL